MHRLPMLLALGAALATSTTARAAAWSDFAEAFPALPCQDGWAACLTGGGAVSPDLQRDRSNTPMPADMRVNWFDLQPTAAFSPFIELSPYTGEVQTSEPLPDPTPTAVASNHPREPGGTSGTDRDIPREPVTPPVQGTSTRPSTPSQPASHTTTRTDQSAAHNPTGEPEQGSDATADASSVRPDSVRPDSVRPDSTPPEQPELASNDAAASVDPGQGTARTEDQVDTPPVEVTQNAISIPAQTGTSEVFDDSCDNLVALEPSALMGNLREGQVDCLEASFAAAARQTEKDKISRILMVNAYSGGDRAKWAALVKRHLNEVDQSDPELCLKYAMYLHKRGPSKSHGVIRWANVALENRTQWSGDEYVNRVYTLYKLRASAAQKLWQVAEEKHAANPTEETRAQVEDARNQTKVFAREWYEYAKAAGRDSTKSLQLCVSAAGTADYCEGG